MPNTIELNLRGLKCPAPVLRLRRATRDLEPGTIIVATCTDPLSAIDVPHFVADAGLVLVEQRRSDAELTFVIRV